MGDTIAAGVWDALANSCVPAYTVSRIRANLTPRSDNPTFPAQLELLVDSLRKAGVPEQ
jgi:hypothetical protein